MKFESDYKMIIDGKAVDAAHSFASLNPASGAHLGNAPLATVENLNEAVAAARAAFPEWSAREISERRDVLRKMAARVDEFRQPLARLLTLDQGKPLAQAEQEVDGCILWLKVIAEQELPVTRVELAERIAETHRVPLGVVGAITPWNFPLLLAIYKIAPALLTGNSVVVKPSPFTTLCTLKLIEILYDLVPAGVLNVVTGEGDIGAALSAHPDIDKISFTGSTATGRKIMETAAKTLKRLTLELGGNDAAIVLPDVDVEETARSVFWAAFFNSGQLCVASKRIYIHEDIYTSFVEAMVAYANEVTMGDGLEQGVALGPINNEAQLNVVADIVKDCVDKDYSILTGGTRIDQPGYFWPVTLVDNPPEHSRVVQEEAFGPVLPLIKVGTVDEAVERANASDLGLGGSVWSKDIDAAQQVAQKLNTANVWINENGMFHPSVPYGTSKQSGIGVENGIEGLVAYTYAKTVLIAKTNG